MCCCRADPQRQKECEELLGVVTNERYAELVAIGKLINDFVGEGEAVAPGADGEGIDEDIGVAVEVRSQEQRPVRVQGLGVHSGSGFKTQAWVSE